MSIKRTGIKRTALPFSIARLGLLYPLLSGLAWLLTGCANNPGTATVQNAAAPNGVVQQPAIPGATSPGQPVAARPEGHNTAPPSAATHASGSPTAAVTHADDHASQGHEGEGHHHEHFIAQGPVVSDHGIPLFKETQTFDNLSPQQRAEKVTGRLNMIAVTHGLEADSVFMRRIRGCPCVFYYHNHGPKSEGHLLATIDPLTAREFGFQKNPEFLAYWWRDVLRDHALVITGQTPRWTTRYAPPMQRLYEFLQQTRRGVPSHESFDLALSKLSSADLGSLRSLYVSVPANYRPQPDDIHAAESAHHHHGDDHHSD